MFKVHTRVKGQNYKNTTNRCQKASMGPLLMVFLMLALVLIIYFRIGRGRSIQKVIDFPRKYPQDRDKVHVESI